MGLPDRFRQLLSPLPTPPSQADHVERLMSALRASGDMRTGSCNGTSGDVIHFPNLFPEAGCVEAWFATHGKPADHRWMASPGDAHAR
ncbi:hypothetical protein [Burkholderia sp. 3C]